MKDKQLLVAICCLAMLIGCQQAEVVENLIEEKLPITIEASIGKDGVVTGRTALGDDGNVSFVDGDAVGLFVNTRNVVEWTYDSDGNIWEADDDIFWDNTERRHQFYAFYPYVDDAIIFEFHIGLRHKGI